MTLEADLLKKDEKIQKGKELILEALREHSSRLKEIRPPQKEKALAYSELIEAFNKLRGAPLFYPYIGSGLGNGCLVELLDGSVKYDMITGIGVHFLGHSHPDLIAASLNAAISDVIMQGNLQQNEEAYRFSKALVQASGLPHCFLTTSGVMANENALKVALQKNAPAHRILAFEHCFAGRSFTFSQVTDKPAYRVGLPTDLPVDYVPFYDPKKPEESTDAAVEQLKRHIARYPGGHALMIFELVQGEAGFWEGSRSFFEPLMRLCKEHHIAVFSDEIQTFGRTSRLFAFQHFGLESYINIVTIGKLSQVAATLFTDPYCPKPGLLSQTFIGSTSGILGGMAILNHLLNGNFYGPKGRMQQIHERFASHLARFEKKHPGLIEGPYGIGAMIAFTPFDGDFHKTTKLVNALYEAGVITFIAGTHPCRVRMLVPAVVITDEEIDQVMEIVKGTVLEHASD